MTKINWFKIISGVILSKRYVDDITCIFNCERDPETFFFYLSSKHKHIWFTFAKQATSENSFLAVLKTKDGTGTWTSVYCTKRH